MKLRTRVIVLAGAAALAVPGVAVAKGPSVATIAGPGLTAPLTIQGNAEGDVSTDLGMLVAEAGFFPQTFGQSPNPLLAGQPKGPLGPKYTVTYTVPGPSTDTLRQYLYPYAANGTLSYMAPGQKIWDQTTFGGWYRGTKALRTMLIDAGLPAIPPAVRGRAVARSSHENVSIALGAGTGIALAGGLLLFLRRRR
jgi:hypothetical protein